MGHGGLWVGLCAYMHMKVLQGHGHMDCMGVCGWVHARYEPKMIHTDWCNGSGWHMPKLIRYVGLIDSCSLRRETWLALYSSTWKLIFIWAEKPWFLYTLLVWTIICCIYIESSWCHVLTIQTLPKVFLIYGDFVFHFSSIPWLKINQSSQSTTKVRHYKDGHVSTCVLGNEPNLLPPSPNHHCHSTWECSVQKMLEDTGKTFTNVRELYFVSPERLVHESVP